MVKLFLFLSILSVRLDQSLSFSNNKDQKSTRLVTHNSNPVDDQFIPDLE